MVAAHVLPHCDAEWPSEGQLIGDIVAWIPRDSDNSLSPQPRTFICHGTRGVLQDSRLSMMRSIEAGDVECGFDYACSGILFDFNCRLTASRQSSSHCLSQT